MAPPKASTPLLLLLTLSVLLAASGAVRPGRPDVGAAGGFFGIPWFGGGGAPGGGIGGGFVGGAPGGGIGGGFVGGWGAGAGGGGGGGGGFARRGVVQPSMVCAEKGPCYNKQLTCPAKCFRSYSYQGKNGGGGGGGGGCSFDCTSRCQAYC